MSAEPPRARILRRIRRLLALSADGSSPEECARALEAAQALMLEHHVGVSEAMASDKGLELEHAFVPRFGRALRPWHEAVAQACMIVTGTILTRGHVVVKGRKRAAAVWWGFAGSPDVAFAVYQSLELQMERFASRYRGHLRAQARGGFAVGANRRASELDAAVKSKDTPESRALVRTSAHVAEAVDRLAGRPLPKGKVAISIGDTDAYADGLAAGRRATFSRGAIESRV